MLATSSLCIISYNDWLNSVDILTNNFTIVYSEPLLPSANRVVKAMFSVVSVCHRGWGPCPLFTRSQPCPLPMYRAPGPRPQTSLNLFNLDLTMHSHTPSPDMFKLVHVETRSVGKRAFGIRLKYLLVFLQSIFS